MNKEKMIKKLVPALGLALVIGGCQSSFLTNADDKGTMSTLNVLSNGFMSLRETIIYIITRGCGLLVFGFLL